MSYASRKERFQEEFENIAHELIDLAAKLRTVVSASKPSGAAADYFLDYIDIDALDVQGRYLLDQAAQNAADAARGERDEQD